MADDFDDARDGDPVPGPDTFNRILAGLRRWRKLSGSGGLTVDPGGASSGGGLVRGDGGGRVLAKLTGPYAAGYPWKEVCFTAGRVAVDTGLTGSAAADPAFERRTGDTTLTADGRVYEMVRSPCSGEWLFPGRGHACLHLIVTVKDCTGVPLSGATVTATDGTTTVGPLTTGAGGVANLTPTNDGSWTATVSKSGFQTMSATTAYTCASGASVLVSYKDFAPASLTITSGSQSATGTRSPFGSSYLYQWTFNYPIGGSFDVIDGVCTSVPTALILLSFGCTHVAYSASYQGCGGVTASGHTIYTYTDQSSGVNGAQGASYTGTVTSFSVSPFLVTGVWPTVAAGADGGFPVPILSGASFTIS